MSEKFQNKYRISSTRLQHWDYGWNAEYFITICTKDREHFFGEIQNGEMRYSEIGELVELEWLKTPEIRPDMYLELGPFVVMPNHFHAIITICENDYNTAIPGRDAMHRVSTNVPDQNSTEYKNKFAPQSKNLSSIIRGFKSAVTIQARKIHADFAWQPRFHDHIIRNKISFNHISDYIQNNPLNWQNDKFFS